VTLGGVGWVCLAAGVMLAGCRLAAPDTDSGVRGRVLVGPSCPVVQAGETCPDLPYPASLDVVNPVGKLVARLEADERGEFAISLPEGTYTLAASAADDTRLPWAEPLEIVVRSGAWTEVTVRMDSGIR
jgi:hypothetical protein